jgi:hypothetical protein
LTSRGAPPRPNLHLTHRKFARETLARASARRGARITRDTDSHECDHDSPLASAFATLV